MDRLWTEAKSVLLIVGLIFSVDFAAVGNNIHRVFVHLGQQIGKSGVMKTVPFICVQRHSSTFQTLDVCRPESGLGCVLFSSSQIMLCEEIST